MATKIRTTPEAPLQQTIGKAYQGFLISWPTVGRGMVIFRDPNGRRMVTTTVRRVLATTSVRLYVETENSVYQLLLVKQPQHRNSATG